MCNLSYFSLLPTPFFVIFQRFKDNLILLDLITDFLEIKWLVGLEYFLLQS